MRKIIVLNNQLQDNGETVFTYAYWLVVPIAIQVALPSATSVVPDATTAEVNALKDGSVIERTGVLTVTSGFNQNDVALQLTRGYNTQQATITAQATAKKYSGTYWDGTSWFNVPA